MSNNRRHYQRYEDRPLRSGQRVYQSQVGENQDKGYGNMSGFPDYETEDDSTIFDEQGRRQRHSNNKEQTVSRYAQQQYDRSVYGPNMRGQYETQDQGAINSGSGTRSDADFGYHENVPRYNYEPSLHNRDVNPMEQRHRKGDDFRGKGPKGYQRSSDRIYEEVCECLMDEPDVDASEISVSVEAGIVSLDGSVKDRATKRNAEFAIENIKGVRDVNNRLSIQSSEYRKSEDSKDNDENVFRQEATG